MASYTFSALLMKEIEELWEMDREGLLERARRRVSGRFKRGPEGGPAEVHVRHRWPPKLEPPAQALGVHAALGVRPPAQVLAAGASARGTKSGRTVARFATATSKRACPPIAST